LSRTIIWSQAGKNLLAERAFAVRFSGHGCGSHVDNTDINPNSWLAVLPQSMRLSKRQF